MTSTRTEEGTRVAALFSSLIEPVKLTELVTVLNDLEAKEEAAAECVV